MRIKLQKQGKRSCFQFERGNDKGDCLLVWSQQTQPHHKQYSPMPPTGGDEGELCKSREWQTFHANLFKYFRLEERKISLTLHVFCLNSSHFYHSHLIFPSPLSFLPNHPAPYQMFSFLPPGYRIIWEPTSFRPSTLPNPTPFFPSP